MLLKEISDSTILNIWSFVFGGNELDQDYMRYQINAFLIDENLSIKEVLKEIDLSPNY